MAETAALRREMSHVRVGAIDRLRSLTSRGFELEATEASPGGSLPCRESEFAERLSVEEEHQEGGRRTPPKAFRFAGAETIPGK